MEESEKRSLCHDWIENMDECGLDDIIDEFIRSEKKSELNEVYLDNVMPCVPYQLCPKCNGQGQVTKPPYIAGDQETWSSSSAIHQCDVCNGRKIIPMHIVDNEPHCEIQWDQERK